jgi:membrane dipeptidase
MWSIVVDCAHASFDATMAVLEASDQPVIISHGQLGHAGDAHPRLLSPAHVTAIASAGGLVGAWPAGLTSRSLADFGTEVIRLTEVAGPGHVAVGTDLDGNYRPVLTSYLELTDLAGLLHDNGLPLAHVRQILGGNAADLLNRVGP